MRGAADGAGQIAAFNLYGLLAGRDAFLAATGALAARVAAEGHPGILHYRFFAGDDGREGAATVIYADAAAWIGHHEIAMGWPEMRAMHAVARLREITLMGPVTAEITGWLARSGLTATLRLFPAAGGGFRRAGA